MPTLENLETAIAASADKVATAAARRFIEFHSPLELRDYRPPQDMVLAGDSHITRGGVFVIGGCPGVGKSRASVALAVAGATGQDWFGLKVPRQFKTLIIQNENGRLRLAKEFSDLNCNALCEWVRVSAPPPYGFAFDHLDFCSQLSKAIQDFAPDVVMIDPWNAAARDEKARDYLETFDRIRSVIPAGDNGPALGIVAHTRKPQGDERNSGRSLMNLISGSYVLTSVPRSVFIMQHASQEPEENRVIWTCCKNNDGDLGSPSVWERRNGLFVPVEGFDWQELNSQDEKRRIVTESDLNILFDGGRAKTGKKQAVEKLMEQTGCAHSAAYNALSLSGRFGPHLQLDECKMLCWKP
jgi:hypothetical protein